MCDIIKNFFKRFILLIIIFLIFLVGLAHFISGFLLKVNHFNSSDLMNSYPLFDFSIGNCQDKLKVIFHRYGGRKDYNFTKIGDFSPEKETKIVDETDIKKINGYYFCYRNISYKNLLNNGQVIKKGEKCPSAYSKNCGTLDTLEQELCINNNDKCPLYDIGLGVQTDLDNYIYDKASNVYYNNDNYNKSNKKIVGRLILNEGQPCYNSTEKLWRQFSLGEGFKSHLKCELEVFGNYSDDRYEERGEISYKRLYQDNLNTECKNLVLNLLTGDEMVHLYKREFFGIDKECDEKYNFNENTYDILYSTEQSESYLLFIEGSIVLILGLEGIINEILEIKDKITYNYEGRKVSTCIIDSIIYLVFIALLFPCFIGHAVFYRRLINNDLTGYNCSDSTTNEILKKGFEATRKNILLTKINFYLDLTVFLGNFFVIFICKIINSLRNDKSEKKDSEIELKNYYSEHN